MYQDTITLFNRRAGTRGNGDTWYPTVIKGVNLNIDRVAILAKYGPESKDSVALHIKFTKSGNRFMVAGKHWKPPKEWEQDKNRSILGKGKLGSFRIGGNQSILTFNPDGDFFWLGEWTGGVVSDSDYGNEGFFGYMNRNYDYVFAVSSAAHYSVIPHFEVMGR